MGQTRRPTAPPRSPARRPTPPPPLLPHLPLLPLPPLLPPLPLLLLLLLSLAGALPAGARAAEMAVIVNLKNAMTRIEPEQAAQIFLGRSDQFTPVDLADNSPIRSEFYRRIAGKDQDQVKAIWSKIVFTGKGFPPKEYNTDAAVKKAVAADPAAIGYIDRAAVDDSVKVVLIVQ